MKFYMELAGDWAYPLSEFTDRIYDGEEKIILEEMTRKKSYEKFCAERMDFIEKGDCGSHCNEYNPCNNISGKCMWLKNSFVGTGKMFKLTNNGLEAIK